MAVAMVAFIYHELEWSHFDQQFREYKSCGRRQGKGRPGKPP